MAGEVRFFRTIVRHSQDWDLCDGAVASFNTTGTFVDGGQIGVHVTGITTTTWDFFSSCRNLITHPEQSKWGFGIE